MAMEVPWEDDEEEPFLEAEDCVYCVDECEDNDVGYERDFKWQGGKWVCQGCGREQE